MTIKTATTPTGKTIKIEMVRKVQAKHTNDWGEEIGREIVEYTNITLSDETGQTLGTDNQIRKLVPMFDGKMISAGAVAKIGNCYLRQDMYDLISNLLAEVEAETPKSEEQIAIEVAAKKAQEDHDAWYNSAEQIAYRKFEARMNAADSDL